MIRELLIQAWDHTVPIFVGNVMIAMVICAAFFGAPFMLGVGHAVFVVFTLLSVWCVLMSVLICWTALAALVSHDDPAPAIRSRIKAMMSMACLLSPAILGGAGVFGAMIPMVQGGAFYALVVVAVWVAFVGLQTLLLAATFVATGTPALRALEKAMLLGLLQPVRTGAKALVAIALLLTSVICFPGLGGAFLWLRAATGRAPEIAANGRRHLSARALLQPWLR